MSHMNLKDCLQNGMNTCYHCQGYYGSNNGHPLCGICHDFLYVEDLDNSNTQENYGNIGRMHQILAEMDYGESGNDDSLATPIRHYGAPQDDIAERIPPEVWTNVFKNLDFDSLLLVSRVNQRWESIISEMFPNHFWRQLVKDQWPLFSPVYEVSDWYSVCAAFVDSLSCYKCWTKMHNPRLRDATPRGGRRVKLELKLFRTYHDGIHAGPLPLDKSSSNWLAKILGPPGSPYEGGAFYLKIKIPEEYPMGPPVVRFLTKIYHPNVSRHGDIGIDIQHGWFPSMHIPNTLLSIKNLLLEPCLEPCMEPSIAQQYKNDPQGFETIARKWTFKHAMIDYPIYIKSLFTKNL